jgi:hypothetical protein
MNPDEKSCRVLKVIKHLKHTGIDGIVEETGYGKKEVQETIDSLRNQQLLNPPALIQFGESKSWQYSSSHITPTGEKLIESWIDQKSS